MVCIPDRTGEIICRYDSCQIKINDSM